MALPAAPRALFWMMAVGMIGCASVGDGHSTFLYMDGPLPEEGPAPAHGPTAGADGWVVSITPEELEALGMGQHMELDMRAPEVVYVVDYWQIEHLDVVLAKTGRGWLPLSLFVKPEKEKGRVVLKAGPRETPPDATSCAPAPESTPPSG